MGTLSEVLHAFLYSWVIPRIREPGRSVLLYHVVLIVGAPTSGGCVLRDVHMALKCLVSCFLKHLRYFTHSWEMKRMICLSGAVMYIRIGGKCSICQRTLFHPTYIFFRRTSSSTQSVHLIGSWDNFAKRYSMERDIRRSSNQWRGCYKFDHIINDGESGPSHKRSGGLKMGSTYYYYVCYIYSTMHETRD